MTFSILEHLDKLAQDGSSDNNSYHCPVFNAKNLKVKADGTYHSFGCDCDKAKIREAVSSSNSSQWRKTNGRTPKVVQTTPKDSSKKLHELSEDDRHAHYSKLLESLSLTKEHRQLLKAKRGFTDDEINLFGFRYVRKWQTLPDTYPLELHGVSGNKLGNTCDGVLIPNPVMRVY